MYIIHETLADNDPRLDSRTRAIGDYWHFTIRQILDSSVYIDWLDYIEISESVAKSHKIVNSYKGIISLSEPASNLDEVSKASADTEYKKYIYELTDEDKKNVMILMKSAMKLFAESHLINKDALSRLLREIEYADSIERCEYVLHHYFGVGSATMNNQPRKPAFKVEWPDEF